MKDYAKAFRLDGKVALVTGGARGLGAEIARAFAQVGARVLIADVLEEAGRSVAAEIAGRGAQSAFVHLDVTQERDWERAMQHAVREWKGIDVLVNCAGIETAALISQCTPEDFRRVLDINVTGTFLGLKHAIRAMSDGASGSRGGSVVNIASIAAMVGTSAHAAYHTSKGAFDHCRWRRQSNARN